MVYGRLWLSLLELVYLEKMASWVGVGVLQARAGQNGPDMAPISPRFPIGYSSVTQTMSY